MTQERDLGTARGVPSLRDLCLSHINDGILNLDNAVFTLRFAKQAFAADLEARALKFVRASFAQLRKRQARPCTARAEQEAVAGICQLP